MSSHNIALDQDVVVTQLKGKIYLVAADGSQKPLAEGDVLPKDAVLITPEGASFNGGNQTFTLSPTNEQQAEDETSQAPLLAQNQDVPAGNPDDIAALQQAILGGTDPTKAFEAAAAGGAPAAGGGNIGGVAGASGNGGFVTIDRTGSATIAEATFDTTYNANGEPPLDAAGITEQPFISANLTLSAQPQVSEGGFITVTASVDVPVFGSDLVITLSNGAVITIPVGQSSGSVIVAAPADSPYVDPSTITVSITGTQGGGFNQIITGPSTTTQINDTIDTTTVTLSAPAQANEGSQITYSASVNKAPQTDLVLTLSNGASITIKAGELSGSVTVDAPDDDVYQDGSGLTVTITGSSGGNYEKLDTSSTVTTVVTDTVDTTTVTLSSATNGQNVTEGGSLVYTASVSSPVTGSPLSVTLSNGVVITIPVGSSSANSEPVPVRADDVYQQGNQALSVSIDKTSGGNYESVATVGTITNTVVDDSDAVTVTLSGPASVVEGATTSAYTVTLSDAAPVGSIVTLSYSYTTASGKDITETTQAVIGADGKTATFTIDTINDGVYEGEESFHVSVGAIQTPIGSDVFELLDLSKANVKTSIIDAQDLPKVATIVGDTVMEGNANSFAVGLTNTSSTDTPLTLTLAGGTATKGADFSGTQVTVTIGAVDQVVNVNADGSFNVTVPANTGSFSVKVSTVNDTVFEASENYTLSSAGTSSTVTGTATITDNDFVVALQDVVEGTTGNVLNVTSGVAFTGMTTLGGTVSLVNGQYVYQAPVRDHGDATADVDSFTYTKADGSTVTYTINILDTTPVATNDSGSFAVGLNVQTTGTVSLLANDTVVDQSVDSPAKVFSVAGLNTQAVGFGATGSVTVAGKYGDLTVNTNGSYTYTSKLDTDVQAAEGGAAVKSAFAVYGFQNNSLPLNGTSLKLSGLTDNATALVDVRTSGNNAKPGIGVSQSGGGTNDIGGGESLVIGLKALSNFAQIGINELNSGQGNASWNAYDANGALVGSGTLVSSSSNGSLQSFNISTNTPFQYLVLGYSGNQNGYVIDSIKYTPAIGAVNEEFTYIVQDNDGDFSNSATLTLNGSVPTTVAPTMLMGVEDADVALTWSSFGISDSSATVRLSGNQNGTGTIQYLDSTTNQYKALGNNETKTFSKADIDSGKVKFDPADNVSGADVYGNGKGVGNQGHDLTSIKFDVLKGNQVVASDKSVVVDLAPVADKPLLSLSGFQSLAAINFEDVKLGTATWSDNVDLNAVQGAGTIGVWKTADGSNRIEVGKESVYVGGGSSINQVMEIEGKAGVKTLYADFNCEGGRFYQLGFDIAARTGSVSSSALTVKLVQLGANGLPISGTERELYNFNPAPTDGSWKLNQLVNLPVDVSAKYRLTFESNDSDSYGAILDNVKFQAVDNKGYEDNFIKLSAINAALVDIDGSETLAVEISGLPKGAVLKDGIHSPITVDDTGKAVITGWSLGTLQLKVNDPGNYNLLVKATATEVTSTGTVLDRAVSEVILPVEVLAANAAPVITATSVEVSEEGLSGGLIDTTDFRGQNTNLDSTNATSVSGKLAISDANGDIIQSVKLVAPTESFTSGSTPIKWSVSTDGLMLTGKVGDNGPTAVTVTIDKQGNYNVNLFKPLDHVNADNVEGRLAINVGVEASDGKATGKGTLTIQVEDDSPVVITHQTAHIEGSGIQTNLMLIVDVSGSMADGSGVPGKTRLDIAKESLLSLLNTYDSLGTTKVRIVTFSNDGDDIGERWMTVSEAKTCIWSLSADGGTNYMGAIDESITAFADRGKLTGQGVQNISYFLSDGEPWNSYGVPEERWINFLKANDIKSYSLGMGSQVSQPALDLAAYDGVSEKNTDAIVVTDMSKLEQVISGTAQRTVSGDLFGQVGTGAGADGGAISTVRVDGHTYTIENGRLVSGADQGGRYYAQSQQLVIALGNGDKLTIGLVTGEYLYQTQQHSAQTKDIGFDLLDADGDKATGTLNLVIEPSDNGRTFVGNGGDDHLTVLNTSQVHIALGGVHGGGSQVMIEENIDTRSGVTLYGGKGNDHLTGGLGDDILSGGTNGHGSSGAAPGGSGRLYYGDLLTGGDGADTFLWQQGEALEQGAVGGNTPPHAIDYITDFHVDHRNTTTDYGDSYSDRYGWYKVNSFKDVNIAKSDKLDLSDLLDHDGTKQEAGLTKLLSVFESGTDVHIQVRASEGSSVVSQEIVLLNTTFESITGDSSQVYDSSTSSASEQVINYMLQNHLLDIDK